jgi:DNA repair exonuclease SbcCD nuclease subunit
MKTVLVIGDVHIKTSNIPDIDIFIKKVCDIISTENPDFTVLLGDILDTFEKINTFELNKAIELIDKIRNLSKVYVIIGNHDMVNCLQYLTENHWANSLKLWDNVVIVDKTIEEDDFIFVPYVPNGRFIDALNEISYDWKNAKCIFAHQEFYGAKMGAIISEEGDKWMSNYPNVISGHLHMNQRPQKNIYYPGSSMQVAYGETDDNIVAIIRFTDENEYDIEEIPLKMSRKKIIYTTIDNVEIPEEDINNKLKMSISGDYEEFKIFKKSKKYKQLISNGVNVVFKPTRKEVKLKNEKIQESIEKNNGSNDFKQILKESLSAINNKYINETYELVVNNKHTDVEIMKL